MFESIDFILADDILLESDPGIDQADALRG